MRSPNSHGFVVGSDFSSSFSVQTLVSVSSLLVDTLILSVTGVQHSGPVASESS